MDRQDISHRAAVLPLLPVSNKQAAKFHIDEIMRILKKPSEQRKNNEDREALKGISCWKDTPERYRKHIARLAGLSLDVAAKMDRDLSESEKSMIRSAARDMNGVTNRLMAM